MIGRLHYISQSDSLGNHLEHVRSVLKAGCTWIQFREKHADGKRLRSQALECKTECQQFGATFIINDHVDLAQQIDADGVHLGKADLQPSMARSILGPDKIIGGTANTFEDILRLSDQGVDYVGLGPFRFTTSKINLDPILGVDGYWKIIKQMHIANIKLPIIAIGGIMLKDIRSIMETGVHGIAVSSLLSKSTSVQDLMLNINKQLEKFKS